MCDVCFAVNGNFHVFSSHGLNSEVKICSEMFKSFEIWWDLKNERDTEGREGRYTCREERLLSSRFYVIMRQIIDKSWFIITLRAMHYIFENIERNTFIERIQICRYASCESECVERKCAIYTSHRMGHACVLNRLTHRLMSLVHARASQQHVDVGPHEY